MQKKETEKQSAAQGSKKLSLLLVLRVLERSSGKDKLIKQSAISKMVTLMGEELKLNVSCDRKTVGRHLTILAAAGYNIVIVKGKGCYLEGNKFTKEESGYLRSVINTSNASNETKKKLTGKLNAQEENLDKETLITVMRGRNRSRPIKEKYERKD